MQHKIHVITLRQIEPLDGKCPFEVSCSCDWQGLTHTLDRAETFVSGHVYAQSSRGHQVIIKRELLSKPSAVDAAQKAE